MLHLMFVHLMGLLSPGPDFFYVSRAAAIHSRRTAIYGVIGITIGVTIWATAAVLGLAIVFKTMPALQGIVMALGGSYLFYLGVKMARVTTNAVFVETNSRQNTESKNEIIKGLLVNLSNAKVVIYFSSVMSFVLVNHIFNFSFVIFVDRTFDYHARNLCLFLCDFPLIFTPLCKTFL